MAAGLIVPISGPYTATWDKKHLGTMDENGFTLSGKWHGQEVNASDVYGMTLVEAVYRGLDWRISFNALEFNRPGVLAIIHTFGSTDPTKLSPFMDNVGDLYSNYAKVLVLTAILGNPPTTPQTLTALYAVIAPETSVPMIMSSVVKEVPIEMVILPYPLVSITLAIPTLSDTVGGPKHPLPVPFIPPITPVPLPPPVPPPIPPNPMAGIRSGGNPPPPPPPSIRVPQVPPVTGPPAAIRIRSAAFTTT